MLFGAHATSGQVRVPSLEVLASLMCLHNFLITQGQLSMPPRKGVSVLEGGFRVMSGVLGQWPVPPRSSVLAQEWAQKFSMVWGAGLRSPNWTGFSWSVPIPNDKMEENDIMVRVPIGVKVGVWMMWINFNLCLNQAIVFCFICMKCWFVHYVHLSSLIIYNSACFLCLTAIVDDERLSAEEMDERRRQNIAYEYLCHLEEAKR